MVGVSSLSQSASAGQWVADRNRDRLGRKAEGGCGKTQPWLGLYQEVDSPGR